MKISDRGLNLIKNFEGLCLKAYKDVAGVWTIGYGHTGNVKEGDIITLGTAERLLREDLARFEKHVNSYDPIYHWTQNEFDAMVSFAFNIGNIHQLTAHGTRDKKTISDKILEYTKSGGKEIAGLIVRRKEERCLFMREPTYGWIQTDYGWKYFKPDGHYAVGWHNINKHRYYFNHDGYAVKGLCCIEKGMYYFMEDNSIGLECALCVTDCNGSLYPLILKED